MSVFRFAAAATAVLITGCAASPETISCLQPDRRVMVEMSGIKVKPPPKNKPKAKPGRQTVLLKAVVQGDSAWDHGSAVLKAGGKSEIDKLVKLANEGTRRDKRPTKVGSIIITGHIDPVEYDGGLKDLDEQRAMAVRDYLASKGLDRKLMFWEGKDATQPVPVTKFCDL